jgi:Tol biopolymer transport system component
MALSAGTRLGPYEILAPLGAGGMGEVYRAHDPRLKRDVALKVLPAELASEPERLGRFQREAETLAALNHPHIVTIYSVEEADEHRFLTMELVEGKTLSKVIPRGGLPLSRFFQIAIPLAEAVSAAHEKGVIHRDLKPGNVMVTEEDRVKVLDFGLAKLREGVRGEVDTQSPTEPATGPGRVMGTAPYMSPEQVQGRALDHRSDVFALGIMLYEMATGEPPFGGDTFADVASSILKDDPVSVTERKADLPRDLAKLIRHCLEKEPRKRLQTTLDLANELEELRREVDSGEALTSGGAPVVSSRAGGKRRIWLVVGAAAVALALAVGALLLRRNVQPPEAPIEITPFTSDGGYKSFPQLSPDGEKVAYAWTGPEDDNWDIYVKPLGVGARSIRLTDHPALERIHAWSPDGRRIAFVRQVEGKFDLYAVPSLGGQEQRLVENVALPTGWTPALAWSPDGDSLVLAEKLSEDGPARITRVPLATLERVPLTSPPEATFGDLSFALSPDGSQLALFRIRTTSPDIAPGEIWVTPVSGGVARRIVAAGFSTAAGRFNGLTWTQDGKEIVFSATRKDRPRMFRVPATGGSPQPVTGIGQDAVYPSIRGRRLVYARLTEDAVDIWRLPGRLGEPGQVAEAFIASSRGDHCPDYSPDGHKIAFSSVRSGVENIWICESDGSNPVQLTDLPRETGWPRWSPDGRRIVLDSMTAGDWNLYVVDAQGGVPRQLTTDPAADFIGDWSRDGRWIYFCSERSGSQQVWKIPAEGGPAMQVTRHGGYLSRESWDGKHLYYSTSEDSGVWRMPVGGGEETAIVDGPLSYRGWALGRSGLYYAAVSTIGELRSTYAICYLDFESGATSEVYRKEGPFRHWLLSVSPDERWVLILERPTRRSELMLVEDFR